MRKKLNEIRETAIAIITAIMHKAGVDTICTYDFAGGDSPIVHEDPFDDNNSYTLDAIKLEEDGSLSFESSSCMSNTCDSEENLDAELLVGIAEWIQDYEDEIMEFYTCEVED